MTIKFFWNGIKGRDGKLWRCQYGSGPWVNLPQGTITIYAKDYRSAPADVVAAFKIENGTDYQTDYFERDRIRVGVDHPMYALVRAAADAAIARHARRAAA